MIRKLVIFFILVLGLTEYPFAENKITITVSAHVLPKLYQRVLYQETKIHISEMDIQRGYIEIFSGTILQITTNNREGYGLFFEGGSELFKEIWVIEKGKVTIISSEQSFIFQPYPEGNFEVKEISYRFFLREDIQPGLYRFPLKVRASLL